MSKERLEEIKYKLYTLHNCTDTDEAIKDFIFYHLKVEWLIEQAERVQELERANKQLERQAPGVELELLNMELTDVLKQNKRYREALKFYANEENYLFDEKEYKVGLGVPESEITIDYGNKARKALEGEE